MSLTDLSSSDPTELKKRRVEIGKSDSIGLSCSCDPSSSTVLLFYRYFSKSPSVSLDTLFSSLSSSPSSSSSSLSSLSSEREKWNAVSNAMASFQRKICEERGMTGKIRVGKEGFNITVAGGKEEIKSYISECISHWSFSSLSLDSQEKLDQYFKPSPGCIHIFDSLSVKVVEEITPLGEENRREKGIYEPKDWGKIFYLSPAEFHERIMARKRGENEDIVLDTRNHYETMIGYFDNAILPPIRRFSSLPSYLLSNKDDILGEKTEETKGKHKDILTYCTGGIRCEKGARWVKDCLVEEEDNRVFTLEGGIHNYLEWAKKEIEEGRMKVEECPWKGRNYVFDARGSLGLGENIKNEIIISNCRGCKIEKTWRLGKCKGIGCHLVIVVCEKCEREGNNWCCSGCEKVSETAKENGGKRKGICECEKERRAKLHEGKQQ